MAELHRRSCHLWLSAGSLLFATLLRFRYVYIDKHVYAWPHICIYIYIYICVCVCMYVCMYVFMYLCMYVCMYVYVYIYTLVHTCMCVYIYIYISGLIRAGLSRDRERERERQEERNKERKKERAREGAKGQRSRGDLSRFLQGQVDQAFWREPSVKPRPCLKSHNILPPGHWTCSALRNCFMPRKILYGI